MKNIDNFRDLRQLIAELETIEVKAARKFIDSFDSQLNERTNKSLKLYNLIVRYPHIVKDKAKSKVSRETDERSFEKLHTRLYEKILDSLLLGININRRGLYSERTKMKFNLRKKLMQASILKARGLNKKAVYYLRKNIKKAKQFELYDELLEFLYEYKWQLTLQKNAEDVARIQTEIDHYTLCRDAVLRGKDKYHEFYLYSDGSGLPNERVAWLMETIAQLQDDYRKTESVNVRFFLDTLLTEFYLAVENFRMAVEVGENRVKLVEKNEALTSPTLLGASYISLATDELQTYDFEAALAHSRKALKYAREGSYNYMTRKEIEIQTLYYLGKNKEALRELNKLIDMTDPAVDAFHLAKRHYIKACIQFTAGNFKGSSESLQETRELEKDKEGWGVGIRVMTILNCIERDLTDIAETNIESLRKHVEGLRDKDYLRERDHLVYRILSQLAKDSFDFKKTMESNEVEIMMLSLWEREHRWEVTSHEFIVFHKWLEAKANGKAYEFAVPDELRKQVNEAPQSQLETI